MRRGDTLFLPSAASGPAQSKPLLIVLHGRGDSMAPFTDLQEELQLPELNLLLVNGHRTLGDGFAWCSLNPSRGVGLSKSRRLLKELVNDVIQAGWNKKNIFLFGFSEGAIVAADFVMNTDVEIGGLISVSGCVNLERNWEHQIQEAARRVPILMTHGWNDDVLPLEETFIQAQQLEAAGLDIDWRTFSKGHDFEDPKELMSIRNWLLQKFESRV
jgi:phospholipase/carboxylesterase